MSDRLDISSLVALVERDKLHKELHKNTWYYIIVRKNHGHAHKLIFRSFETPSTNKVLEYLIYNDTEFFCYILSHLNGQIAPSDELHSNILSRKKKRLSAEQVIEKMIDKLSSIDTAEQQTIPTLWAEWLFRRSTSDIIRKIFNDEYNRISDFEYFYVFDNVMRQVLPIADDTITNAYLEQWNDNNKK